MKKLLIVLICLFAITACDKTPNINGVWTQGKGNTLTFTQDGKNVTLHAVNEYEIVGRKKIDIDDYECRFTSSTQLFCNGVNGSRAVEDFSIKDEYTMTNKTGSLVTKSK